MFTPLRFFRNTPIPEETPVVPVEDNTPEIEPLPDLYSSSSEDESSDSSAEDQKEDHKHDDHAFWRRNRKKKPKKKKKKKFSKDPRKRDVKNLPKIDFSKLVTLTLTNFCEFKESMKTVGYARCWPDKFSNPTSLDLLECDSEYFDDEVRKEAFLVIYQMISASLLYLVKNIAKGEVLLLWKALYHRFMFVTPQTLKIMKKEWETLSMGSLNVDQFISLVCEKADALTMVGVDIGDFDRSTALLCGLDSKFDWVRNHYSTKEEDDFTYEEVCRQALKFASNHHLFRKGSKESPTDTKRVCYNYNSDKGCSRKNCPFPHKKIPKEQLAKLKAKRESGWKDKGKDQGKVNFTAKEPTCYKCGEKGHISPKCPHKDLIDKSVQQVLKQAKGRLHVADKGSPKERKKFLFPLFNVSQQSKDLILDSGASQHVVNNSSLLTDAKFLSAGECSFTVGNNQALRAEQLGDLDFGGGKLQEVYYCPECPLNLISEARLISAGADVVKRADTKTAQVVVDDVVVMEARMRDGLFFVEKVLDEDLTLQKYASRYY